MKNHNILLLCLFFSALASCTQDNKNITEKETNEKIIIEDRYTDSLFLEKLNANGLFPFEENNKVGFKNKTGNIIVDAKYDLIPGIRENSMTSVLYEFLEENTFLVGIKNSLKGNREYSTEYLFGLMDINGKEIVKPTFELVQSPYTDITEMPFIKGNLLGVYFPNQDKKNVFINSKGEIFDLSKYNSLMLIDDNLIRVEKNGKFGVVTKRGELKIPIIYDGIQVNASLIQQNKTIIEVCIGCSQIDVDNCGSGDGIIENFVKGKHGLIDENGIIVIPLNYESIFSCNKVVFLNIGGKIKKDESKCEYFSGGQWEMYDPMTNKYSKTEYRAFDKLNSDLFIVNFKDQPIYRNDENPIGKWGIINSEGKEILPMKYSSIYIEGEDRVTARIGEIEEVYVWDGKQLTKVK